MTIKDANRSNQSSSIIKILRPKEIRNRIGISPAKYFDMIAKEELPRPFPLTPGGRAVGLLESDLDAWILSRKAGGSK
jgi:predicted DNA-binding transcriptional regulator AlpA